MKRYQVRIAEEAEWDLSDIYHYDATNDALEKADDLLEQLESRCLSLAETALRGHVPPELSRIGVTAYREVHFKPYRIIYEVIGQVVFVHCVLDGRRDMQSLLARRLLH